MLVHSLWQGIVAFGISLMAEKGFGFAARIRHNIHFSVMLLWVLSMFATFATVFSHSSKVATKVGYSVASGAETAAPVSAAPVPFTDRIFPYLVVVWGLGLLFCSLRLVWGLWGVRSLNSHSKASSMDWQSKLDELCQRLDLSRRVQLRLSDAIDSPVAMGLFKAVVVLPTSALLHLSPSQTEALLVHELAHVKRNDYLLNMVQAIIESVLFYHPAVWWISARCRDQRELSCDDIVVSVLENRANYAHALAEMERLRGEVPRLAIAAKGGNLLKRIKRILGVAESNPQPLGILGGATLAGFSMTTVLALNPGLGKDEVTVKINAKNHSLTIWSTLKGLPRNAQQLKPKDKVTLDGKTVQASMLTAGQKSLINDLLGANSPQSPSNSVSRKGRKTRMFVVPQHAAEAVEIPSEVADAARLDSIPDIRILDIDDLPAQVRESIRQKTKNLAPLAIMPAAPARSLRTPTNSRFRALRPQDAVAFYSYDRKKAEAFAKASADWAKETASWAQESGNWASAQQDLAQQSMNIARESQKLAEASAAQIEKSVAKFDRLTTTPPMNGLSFSPAAWRKATRPASRAGSGTDAETRAAIDRLNREIDELVNAATNGAKIDASKVRASSEKLRKLLKKKGLTGAVNIGPAGVANGPAMGVAISPSAANSTGQGASAGVGVSIGGDDDN